MCYFNMNFFPFGRPNTLFIRRKLYVLCKIVCVGGPHRTLVKHTIKSKNEWPLFSFTISSTTLCPLKAAWKRTHSKIDSLTAHMVCSNLWCFSSKILPSLQPNQSCTCMKEQLPEQLSLIAQISVLEPTPKYPYFALAVYQKSTEKIRHTRLAKSHSKKRYAIWISSLVTYQSQGASLWYYSLSVYTLELKPKQRNKY